MSIIYSISTTVNFIFNKYLSPQTAGKTPLNTQLETKQTIMVPKRICVRIPQVSSRRQRVEMAFMVEFKRILWRSDTDTSTHPVHIPCKPIESWEGVGEIPKLRELNFNSILNFSTTGLSGLILAL